METIFIDTSAWYAYFSNIDHKHPIAISQFELIDIPLLTTDYIINETITLISKRLNPHLAYKVGNDLLSQRFAQIVQVSLDDANSALEILYKYSDKKFSFTDCVSFVVMEKLKIKTAFAFDEHFKQYGKFVIIP